MNLKWLSVIMFVAVLMVTAACRVQPPGLALLRLDFTQVAMKTIQPGQIIPDSYRITLTNGALQQVYDTSNTNPIYELTPGTWDIVIEAMDDQGRTVASGGQQDVELPADVTTTVQIDLTALREGAGSIDVQVDWSAAPSVTVTAVQATLDGSPVTLTVDTSSAGYYEPSIQSGDYRLIFALDYGGASQLSVEEAVQVYDNLTSAEVIYLDEGDFTPLPSVPDNLAAVAQSSSEIYLSWQDTSNIEEGFRVERSEDGISFTEVATVLENGTSYTDSGLTCETQYYYQVRAYNSTGGSGYSNAASALTRMNTLPPAVTERLVFIHHSCGDNWLDTGNGNLGDTLGTNNYYVRDIYYGWDAPYNVDIGNETDTDDWPTWFTDMTVQENGVARRDNIMNAVYTTDSMHATYSPITNPGGENDIIMFKSCYPLSEVGDSIDDEKAIYNEILSYFELHPDKLFILVTPPGESTVSSYVNTHELCQWLVDEENGWLAAYPLDNVGVFDFYCVLSELDSRHTVENGQLVYSYAADYDGVSPFHDGGNNHPNAAGNQKSTDEFVPLLNRLYNRWKGN
jgi:hypothetical protein